MGNEQSNGHKHGHGHKHHPHGHNEEQINPEVAKAFLAMSNGESSIGREQFLEKAGQKLGTNLWHWMQENGREMSQAQFGKCANTLTGMSQDGLVKILMPAQNLIESCFETQGISGQNEENALDFIHSLVEEMTSNGESANVDSVNRWINENCPRLLEPVRHKIHGIFHGKNLEVPRKVDSELLISPAQMFILRQSLPTTLFWPKPASVASLSSGSPEDWLLLYSSSSNGLSVNRFETNVFEYRGPTVAIFRLCTGQVSAIAADEEWRHSTKPFGGPSSILFKFSPKFKRIDSAPPAIYCNFKNRSAKLGLGYGRDFSLDGDLSGLADMEVWGCAGLDVLDEQKKMKFRHKQAVERNAKVALPGKWDENPDKSILEMGGIQFSNERRDFQVPDHS